jgi:hypothetical protein
MAILPLLTVCFRADAYSNPVRTGQTVKNRSLIEGLAVMGLFIILFFIVTVGLAMAGFTRDSRDGADWIDSWDGMRQPRRG